MELAVLRLTEVIQKSEPGKRAEAQLRSRAEELNQRVKEHDRAAALAEAEARKQTDMHAASAKLREAGRLRRQAEHEKREASIELEELRRQLTDETLLKAQPLIAQISNERGVDVVLLAPNPGLAYYTPKVDITAELIERMNALAEQPSSSKGAAK